MVKDMRGFTFEDMAEARLSGFMDCIQVLEDVKISDEEIKGLIKGYRSIWMREYMKRWIDGQSND